MRRPARRGTQAIGRAIDILKAFRPPRSEWTATDLAAHLGLHGSTVSRMLVALESEGMLARDSGAFRLGPTLIVLGAHAARSWNLHDAARPELDRLARETGETVTLETLVGGQVLILDEVHGRHLIGSAANVGTLWPAYATSTGKALLEAALYQPVLGAARDALRGPFTRLTSRTIVSAARLRRELASVHRRGYATAVEEIELGFVAVGAAVRNSSGRAVAAISVGGPRARFGARRIRELGVQVQRAAKDISVRLGAPPPSLSKG